MSSELDSALTTLAHSVNIILWLWVVAIVLVIGLKVWASR